MKSFFSAHPKIDPATGTIYNQGVILGPSPKLNLMKVRRTYTSVRAAVVVGHTDQSSCCWMDRFTLR